MAFKDLRLRVIEERTGIISRRIKLQVVDEKENYCLDQKVYPIPTNINTQKAGDRWMSKRIQEYIKEVHDGCDR